MKYLPASLCRLWRTLLAFVMVLTLLGALLPGAALAAPPASAAKPAVESGSWGCSFYHTVQRGETLSGIAVRYGTTVHAIMQANHIWNPNHIRVGQDLCIPGYCPPDPGAGCSCRTYHYVRWGETLASIAHWYGVSPQAIASCNSIWNWNRILAGTQLCIPGGWHLQPPPPPPPPVPPPLPPVPPPLPPVPPPLPPVPPPPAYGVWIGEYYASRDFAPPPAFVRQDNAIAFDWGTWGPGAGMPGTNFSAKWNQTAWFDAGTYRFTATVDDGVRVFVDDRLVIDAWRVGPALSVFNDIYLPAGWHTVRVEYFQEGGVAVIYVQYARL